MKPAVIVVPSDPNWAAAFAEAAGPIGGAFGENLLQLHHIGSTSIPNIYAKPVIDMLAVVSDLAAVEQRTAQLAALGYEAMGEFGIPGRRYFRRQNSAGVRSHQIHAFQKDSLHVARHLAFRDFLRTHPAIAKEYSDLKCQLAEAHPNDINAYMDGKDGFIKEMEVRALAWAIIDHSRPLTADERRLARWMLEHGTPEARDFLPQLEVAEVSLWRCPCGCASINFQIKDHQVPPPPKMHILADFFFGADKDLSGIFIYESGGVLRGLEVYGLAGDAPKSLPTPESLRPLDKPTST